MLFEFSFLLYSSTLGHLGPIQVLHLFPDVAVQLGELLRQTVRAFPQRHETPGQLLRVFRNLQLRHWRIHKTQRCQSASIVFNFGPEHLASLTVSADDHPPVRVVDVRHPRHGLLRRFLVRLRHRANPPQFPLQLGLRLRDQTLQSAARGAFRNLRRKDKGDKLGG